jgi:aspartyl/asparaginyl beta-hydroxylase (cupin superfamily)
VKWQPAEESDAAYNVETAPPEQPSRAQADEDQILCRSIRDEILEIARSYKDQRQENESKDRIGFSTVAKLYDCALKWHRAAMEERMKRGDEEFATWLVEEKRRLLNRGAH